MTEDTTPERIPFEEHPLYPLYKKGREQWNRFMKRYLKEDQIAEISERNSTIARDFKLRSTLTEEQEDIFNDYITRNSASEESSIFYPFDFESYIFRGKVNFSYRLFPNHVSFSNAKFSNEVNFQNTQFSKLANFKEVEFSGWIDFENAQFLFPADFERARFLFSSNFEGAQFLKGVDFKATKFSFLVFFNNTQFLDATNFQCAQFAFTPQFKNAQFRSMVDFKAAEFSESADFESAQFLKGVGFERAIFEKQINFSNSTFKSGTDFTGTIFKQFVPQFYEATLHQNTIFDNTIWPNSSNIQDEQILSSNQSAYNCLVLEMNKQLRHEQELYFFAKELEAKRHMHWHRREVLTWLLNYLYSFTSDYGRSIGRPVRLIFLPFLFSLLINILIYWDKIIDITQINCNGLGHIYTCFSSIKNSVEFDALEKITRYTFLDFLPGGPLLQQRAVIALFNEVPQLPQPHILLDIVNSFASVVILAGFFLLGLGLRNRFRIR